MSAPVPRPTAKPIARASGHGIPNLTFSTTNDAIATPPVTPAERSISPSSSTNTSAMPSTT